MGVLSNAYDLGDALLLAISTAVAAAGAEIGLVHRARRDLFSVVTVGGHGPRTERRDHLRGVIAAASLKQDQCAAEIVHLAESPRRNRRGLIEAIMSQRAAWMCSAISAA